MTLALSPGPEPRQLRAGEPPPFRRLVGLEEELLLVDAETFLPLPVSGDILRSGDLVLPGGTILEAEVKREQIEVVSPPLSSHAEILDAIIAGRRAADALAQNAGARAVALATPADRCEPHLAQSARYERMRERFGLTLDEQLTCGLHVHVTIQSPEEGVAVLDRIRPWLPVLLALSANSPYWQGVDSRFASYRYQAWNRWPSAGPYDRFHTVEGYTAMIADILATGVSLDQGMIYFDARLSSHAPTVEIRVADVCFAPQDAACLAVLIRALVESASDEWRRGVPAADIPTPLLRLASWRASRWGLTQELISPATGLPVPTVAVIDELLASVGDHFDSAEEAATVRHGLTEIIRRGNGAIQQRRIRAVDGQAAGIVQEALAWVYDGAPGEPGAGTLLS